MSGEPSEYQKSKPWQWPGEWMKDEKFWKDVASRTVSTVLAVGVVYLYGLAVGYFKTPQIVATTFSVIALVGLSLVVVVLGFILVRGNQLTSKEKVWRPFNVLLGSSLMAAIIAVIVVTATTDWTTAPDPFLGFLE